jgi:hypothetical protein
MKKQWLNLPYMEAELNGIGVVWEAVVLGIFIWSMDYMMPTKLEILLLLLLQPFLQKKWDWTIYSRLWTEGAQVMYRIGL